jgi:hypothetical protein
LYWNINKVLFITEWEKQYLLFFQGLIHLEQLRLIHDNYMRDAIYFQNQCVFSDFVLTIFNNNNITICFNSWSSYPLSTDMGILR